MGWLDNLQNIKFAITTGDGKTYYPLWKSGEKSKDFNTTVFNFIDVPGSLVERKRPQSSKYPLVFWFQGDDNVEQSEAFEKSAEDKRIWTVIHPFYGTIKGQPVSIARNDNNYNLTEITVDFWESIDVDYPNSNFSVQDNTLARKDACLESSAKSYAAKDVFKSEDIQKNKTANNLVASSFTNTISSIPKEDNLVGEDVYANYQTALSSAQKTSDNLLDDAFKAIQQSQSLLDLPSSLDTSVKIKLQDYLIAYSKLKGILKTVADKLFFQSMGAACISSYCNASVNFQDGDFQTIPEVEAAVSDLITMYEDYLLILDQNSVSIYDVENVFQPDASVQSDLNDIVNFTVGNLYQLAFEAQQERIVHTSKDTNLILLTHRYLGLDATDENIERFRTINNIKLKELFKIKKGRAIKYYV